MSNLKICRLLSLTGVLLFLSACSHELTGVLNPKGIIAFQERQLLFDSLALMMVVVLPVIVMSFAFIWRYRETHKTADYKPNWCHSVMLESIWWGVPMAIIMIIGIMTWETTHSLDPYEKINVEGETLKVQVVALPWKWLFIYPEQGVATINELDLPVDRQVEFELTSDNVPMSAFFVPQLGSQIYTMAGMRTQLHYVATHLGTLQGLNSQYNGEGFSEMHFKVHILNESDMNAWFEKVKQEGKSLDAKTYAKVRENSIADAPVMYSSVEPNLFKRIIDSYKASDHPKW